MPKALPEREIIETYEDGGEDDFLDTLAYIIARNMHQERILSDGKTSSSTDPETHPHH